MKKSQSHLVGVDCDNPYDEKIFRIVKEHGGHKANISLSNSNGSLIHYQYVFMDSSKALSSIAEIREMDIGIRYHNYSRCKMNHPHLNKCKE